MIIRHGVIWTRVSGEPIKMGDLTLEAERATFSYTSAFRASGQPGLGVLADSRFYSDQAVIYPISEAIPVLPPLRLLIPGHSPRNLQRRHLLDMLKAQGGPLPPPGTATDWALLLMAGHGGIGHLDVFADDLVARDWYSRQEGPMPRAALATRGRLWEYVRREVRDEPGQAVPPAVINDILGPTPSVGGMIPKLLASIDTNSHALYPPNTPGMCPIILKVEPPEYLGLLDLEALCLDLHKRAGIDTPQNWRITQDGLELLAIERFDRTEAGTPIPMETFFSVIATGRHSFHGTQDILLEELPDILGRLQSLVGLSADTGQQVFQRLLLALFTGNGDLHLDNLAILGGAGDCRLSPVYDPAPMRAWPRHNLVSAIPFDAEEYANHGALFRHLGKGFGLSSRKIDTMIDHALEVTSDYPSQVLALTRVPAAQRHALVQIAADEREALTGGPEPAAQHFIAPIP